MGGTIRTMSSPQPLSAERRWVHMPVEVKVRELESRVLLTCCLVEAGYGVIIGQQSPLRRQLHRLPRGLYFDKCISPYKEDFIASRVELGYLNVSIDEEGLAAEPQGRVYARSRYAQSTIDDTEQLYVWGQLESDIITADYPSAEPKLRLTGNPRVDLWRNVFAKQFADAAARLKRQHGDYILVPSNFGEAGTNPESAMADNLERYAQKMAETMGGYAEDFIEGFRGIFENLQTKFTALCPVLDEMAKRFADRTIIIRPHPGDRMEAWTSRFANHRNIKVIHEGPVAPWLIGAATIVHCGCTTAIEGYFLDKPVISFLPNLHPDHDTRVANKVSRVTHEPAELLDALEAALASGRTEPSASRQAIARVLYFEDDRTSCDQIVEALGELDWPAQPMRYRRRPVNKAYRDWWRGSEAVNRMRSRMAKVSPREHKRRYSRQKFPVLAQEELQGLIDLYGRIFSRFDRVRAHALDHNLYAVVKDA